MSVTKRRAVDVTVQWFSTLGTEKIFVCEFLFDANMGHIHASISSWQTWKLFRMRGQSATIVS